MPPLNEYQDRDKNGGMMGYDTSNVLIHRSVSSKGHATNTSLQDNDVISHHHSCNDNNSKSLRQRRLFTRRATRISTRVLIVAVIVQLAVILLSRHCREGGRLLSHRFSSSHPLVVQAPSTRLNTVIRLQHHKNPPRLIQSRENRDWRDENKRRPEHKLAPPSIPEGCEGEEWMTEMHPSCLDIHEIDMTDFFFNKERTHVTAQNNKRRKKFRFIGEGGFRATFMFHEEATGARRVLKTLVFDEDNRDFNPRNYDRMRRDAIISEQLTASPYIADIFGYCGQAAVFDYSNEENMDYIYEQKTKPTKDELFQVAYDVAQSVADAHHLNAKGRSTVVHMDIKPDQWIKLDGRYKLNDFNLARFLTWNATKEENCNVASGYSGGRYQAPEQFIEESPRTDKIDIFSLGNVLGFLLTNEEPFEDVSADSAEDKVTQGEIWKITNAAILNSTHPFDVNVQKAMEMCLQFEPTKRASAQEVADFLQKALDEYNASKQQ